MIAEHLADFELHCVILNVVTLIFYDYLTVGNLSDTGICIRGDEADMGTDLFSGLSDIGNCFCPADRKRSQ